ncbi:hypothetical protein M0813_22198 [Anaeramoeba flamelloides]|uniref:TH1 domain-containing protein n=1 Tax=Anaeramoeba flamelloides TaxID=1746091 RepID=A0ABQ8YGN0_9EUKA|nr:hypothetical protein M0813_22198 [Anaeramoeba flamelloides]
MTTETKKTQETNQPQDRLVKINKLFDQNKSRRRSSAMKEYHGNYLRIDNKKVVANLLQKNNDSTIIFCDTVAKINKRNKVQERVLLVTDQNVYNLNPSSYQSLRKIPLIKITSITLSCFEDNFFVLGVEKEYDYLIVSSRKTEIVCCLLECCEKLNKKIDVQFTNNFNYRPSEGVVRELRFRSTDEGVSTEVYQKKKKKN